PNTPGVTLQVAPALVLPPAPCPPGNLSCYLARSGKTVLSIGLPALVILILILLFLRPRPFGMMVDTRREPHPLGQGRTFWARLLHPSRLRSERILIEWDGASFVLRFKHRKRVTLTARMQAPAIAIKRAETGETLTAPAGRRVYLQDEDRLLVEGKVRATFYKAVDLS